MKKISIENNVIGNEGLKAFAIALKDGQSLQEFYLYNNEIDDEPLDDFCKFLRRQ